MPCRFPENVNPYLHLNIQNARSPLLLDLLYRFDACSITVAPECRVFNKPFLLNQVIELIFGYKVILDAILLTAAWITCGVRHTEPEAVRVFVEEALEDCGLSCS